MMKTISRLIWTLPYVLTIYFILKLILTEDGCWGVIETWELIFLTLALLVTGVVAIVVAFRKRRTNKLKFEPYTFTLIVLTTSLLLSCKFWSNLFRPKTALFATVNVQGFSEIKHSLTLRKDNTYKVRITGIETSCDYIGHYSFLGDTVFLDNDLSLKTQGEFVDKYLFKNNKLTPVASLVDTMKPPWQLSVSH